MHQARLQRQLKGQVKMDTETGCWLWQGQISNTGRGRFAIMEEGRPRMVSAEDASYVAFIGSIPEQHLVRQRCGNRLCINPEHLEAFNLVR